MFIKIWLEFSRTPQLFFFYLFVVLSFFWKKEKEKQNQEPNSSCSKFNHRRFFLFFYFLKIFPHERIQQPTQSSRTQRSFPSCTQPHICYRNPMGAKFNHSDVVHVQSNHFFFSFFPFFFFSGQSNYLLIRNMSTS